MPRRARLVAPGIPLHLIQRGNNRSACFYATDDCLCYLEWLAEYARQEDCAVHAYVLMTNHVHLLVTPATADGPGAMMKRLRSRTGSGLAIKQQGGDAIGRGPTFSLIPPASLHG